jgi:hypothetical protein
MGSLPTRNASTLRNLHPYLTVAATDWFPLASVSLIVESNATSSDESETHCLRSIPLLPR